MYEMDKEQRIQFDSFHQDQRPEKNVIKISGDGGGVTY